ncbi:hypothetical protein DEU56DRAFT_333110 [Suillus clintonianus]|uniref:uncharacterized protein n=1 Tax=Suillus clintonianus TaxID=1904413 RepID=UPI001B87D8C0|nr:uncharacterized protein DEU56DRAFT_333110 [Suillus clintonianus]KAG2139056.1 hypothetical protein DEU56DRAFT_333110 [Suillus clintonianus]
MSTTTTITPEEIQALDLYLSTAPKMEYICIAALTLFTWDLILTFPHEVRLWNTKWTLAKALFFVNRYFALGAAILMTFLTFDVAPTWAMCSANAFFAVIALLLVANIEMILQLRLYALYAYDKRIVLPVSALFIMVFSGMMVMAVVIYQYEKNHETQIFGACAILGSVDWLYLFWVPMMGLDFVLVVLAGYKSLQHYFQVPDKSWSGARLMRTFARDSILYFLCNFLIYLFSTLLGKFGPAEYYQLGAITITVVPPVSANRLLINMYDSAHPEQVGDRLRIHHEDIELKVRHKDIELASISMEGSLEVGEDLCRTLWVIECSIFRIDATSA